MRETRRTERLARETVRSILPRHTSDGRRGISTWT